MAFGYFLATMRKKIFAKKSIHTLLADSEANKGGLKKTLGWFNLTALGVGATPTDLEELQTS
jgi:hypothetical protein